MSALTFTRAIAVKWCAQYADCSGSVFPVFVVYCISCSQITCSSKFENKGQIGYWSVVFWFISQGLPCIREKSEKNKIFSRSGNCQGILAI